jgi:hypothetical protein
MLKDVLLDVVKHTNGLGFIEAIKIEGTAEETNISGMDVDRTVMLYGQLHNTVDEFEGTFGAANLGYLNWLLNWDYLNDDGSNITVIRKVRNSIEQPEEVEFKGSAGSPWYYRFMSGALVEEQLRTVRFKGADWDVEFQPSQKSIQLFNTAAQGIVQFEPYFSLSTDGGNLSVGFGTGQNSHRGQLVFANNIQGKLSTTFHWPIAQVMAILKLASSGNCKISIASVGALQIAIDSGTAIYNYVLPAKS